MSWRKFETASVGVRRAGERGSDGGVLAAVVGGVAVLAVQARVAHAHVGAGAPVAQRRAARRAREAAHVVAQRQRLDDHRRAATCPAPLLR